MPHFDDPAKKGFVQEPRRNGLNIDEFLTPGRGPVLICRGQAVFDYLAKFPPRVEPIPLVTDFGPVTFVPGTILGDKILLVKYWSGTVTYVDGDGLYECDGFTFFRDVWFRAAEGGVGSAKGMVELAQAEIEFLYGVFVPARGMAALTVAKIGLFYYFHKTLCHEAFTHIGDTWRVFQAFRERCNRLYSRLKGKLLSLDTLFFLVKKGVSAEDVAFWLGRILGWTIKKTPTIPVWQFVREVGFVTLAVAALHSPQILTRAGKAFSEEEIEQIRLQLSSAGWDFPKQEVSGLLNDIQGDPPCFEMLSRVSDELGKLAPLLQQLESGLQ